MNITVTIGSWIIPAFITLIAMGFGVWMMADEDGGAYGVGALIGCGFIMIGAIVSLVSWLIWSLLV